jgi:hypothetical protein
MRRRDGPSPNFARLFRNKKKCESWQSDFRGKILLQDGVSYFVGVTVRTTFAGEEYLAIYLRPLEPYKIPRPPVVNSPGRPYRLQVIQRPSGECQRGFCAGASFGDSRFNLNRGDEFRSFTP